MAVGIELEHQRIEERCIDSSSGHEHPRAALCRPDRPANKIHRTETKGMSKKDLSIRADVHRTYLIGLFQEIKPEPKLARALEVDLVIEKRRELPTLVSPAEQPVPPSQPQGPSPPVVATAQVPAASSPSTRAATPPPAPPRPPKAPPSGTSWSMGASWAPPVDPPPQEQPAQRDSSQRATARPTAASRPTATPPRPATSASTAPEHTAAPPFTSARDGRQGERDPLPPAPTALKPSKPRKGARPHETCQSFQGRRRRLKPVGGYRTQPSRA